MEILGAFKSLWNSEKAVAGGMLIISATVLAALGHMDIATWTDYTKWIFGLYIAGKTTQGAVAAIAGGSSNGSEAAEASEAVTDAPVAVPVEEATKPLGLLGNVKAKEPHGPGKTPPPNKKSK